MKASFSSLQLPRHKPVWRRWNDSAFSPTFVLSLDGRIQNSPPLRWKVFFLPRYVLQIHLALDSTLSMCHLFTLAIWGKRCASDEAACAACHPWKGPVWNEELSSFPDLVVGNPQWWVSGNKIKWLETQTWVPIVPEAKNASQAGFSRQPWQAAGTRLRGLLVATRFYCLKTRTPARNTSLWTKFSSFLALSSLEANRNGKVHKV